MPVQIPDRLRQPSSLATECPTGSNPPQCFQSEIQTQQVLAESQLSWQKPCAANLTERQECFIPPSRMVHWTKKAQAKPLQICFVHGCILDFRDAQDMTPKHGTGWLSLKLDNCTAAANPMQATLGSNGPEGNRSQLDGPFWTLILQHPRVALLQILNSLRVPAARSFEESKPYCEISST